MMKKEQMINTKKGDTYKLIEIREGQTYELKKQRKNGVFARISKFNATSLQDALMYSVRCKIF